ncbi:MAG: diguanylate cyclase [Actinomycetota bacterium]|nr:diguanylate cyclase [Actinomycetota bacterium]
MLRDELAEHRVRRSYADRANAPLSEPDREEYELRLDAYEVQLAEYRARLADYASQLEVAHHDGLTGAWLRHAGRQLLEEELSRADRQETPLSIAFVDVDGLKTINDRLGHAAGDHALITVARALIVGLRGYDHVVRWGGDEFLCVLPGITEEEATRRLRQAQGFLSAGSHQLAISVGVAERRAGETLEQLVSRADHALYVSRGRRLRL